MDNVYDNVWVRHVPQPTIVNSHEYLAHEPIRIKGCKAISWHRFEALRPFRTFRQPIDVTLKTACLAMGLMTNW
jgi:hypothetical protein